MGILKKLGDKMAQNPEQSRAQEIRTWCTELAERGVVFIAESRPRTRGRVAGVVQSLKVVPRQDAVTLEAEVWDGSDRVVALWYGRRRIPGIELGTRLILEGTLTQSRGPMQMVNPAYELLATTSRP